MGSPRALIVDYGGVLTRPLAECHAAWCAGNGVDPAVFDAVFRDWRELHPDGDGHPVHLVETGRITPRAFELRLAERLRRADGTPVDPDGLLTGLLARFTPDPEVIEAVRRARRRVPTALLTNSWGAGRPWTAFGDLFDAVVVSCEAGVRKPDPRSYTVTADALGVPPSACAFVDDSAANVAGAVALGMTGLHHTGGAATARTLDGWFAAAPTVESTG